MRNLLYTLIIIAVISLLVLGVIKLLQPILPENINNGLVLVFAVIPVVCAVVAALTTISNALNKSHESKSKRTTLQRLASEQLGFFDQISANSNPDDIEKYLAELIKFVKNLKMGGVYAGKIEGLTQREIPPQIFVGDSTNSTDKITKKYLEQIRQAYPQIRSIVDDVLRLQDY